MAVRRDDRGSHADEPVQCIAELDHWDFDARRYQEQMNRQSDSAHAVRLWAHAQARGRTDPRRIEEC